MKHSLKIGIHTRLNLGNPTSFAFLRSNTTRTINFSSPLILWLGELKSSTTKYITVLNSSGRDYIFLDAMAWFIDTT